MLFELTDSAAVLRPVAGIVHARGEFVDDQVLRRDEKFNPDDADIVERVQDFRSEQDGVGSVPGLQAGGSGGATQDAVLVDVFAGIEGGDRTVEAAGGDDADFLTEGDESFEDRGGALQRGKCCGGLVDSVQTDLTLAVIAKASGFSGLPGCPWLQAPLAGHRVFPLQRKARSSDRGRAGTAFRSGGPG